MSSKLSDNVTEKWANNAMAYVMASTTVHKRASASLIFDASKAKWTEVFESLQLLPPMGTTGNVHSNITEIAECNWFLNSGIMLPTPGFSELE
jgi:hypothetical protein